MIKKIVLIMVLLFIFLVGYTSSLENKSEGYEPQAYRIIAITLTDYREYLRTNSPLDRLYLKGDVGFFLVKSEELKEVEKSGVTIR